jgi:hypothetical protein
MNVWSVDDDLEHGLLARGLCRPGIFLARLGGAVFINQLRAWLLSIRGPIGRPGVDQAALGAYPADVVLRVVIRCITVLRLRPCSA